MPSPIFVSHGAPTLILEPVAARSFMQALGAGRPRPAAILAVSAHWETGTPRVSRAEHPETIHDFGGFAPELYRLRYPAPGAPALAGRVVELLTAAGFDAAEDPARGLDHGAWVPLMLMRPEADVPVAQLSIQPALGAEHHLRLGAALAPLAAEGVLVLGSGSAVHNLGALAWNRQDAPESWAVEFDAWLADAVARGDRAALADYRRRAPHAVQAHPRDEHLLPLLVAFGAGGAGVKGRRLHGSFTHGNLSMAAYEFGTTAAGDA